MRESFVLYKSFYGPIKSMSQEERGLLLDAIFSYQIDGVIPELPPVVSMAFLFIKSQFDRDIIKYETIVERNKRNGALGGRPEKKPSGLSEKQKNPGEPKKADNDTVTDSDNNKYKEIFEEFRRQYKGKKRGLNTEWENFSKKNSEEIVSLLTPALEREIQYHLRCEQNKIFHPEWKDLRTWINQKCWEQEFPDQPGQNQPELYKNCSDMEP